MGLRVTKAVTKYGHYYAVGDVIDNPTGTERSLGRLFRWETVTGPKPGLTKSDLLQLAQDRGLEVDGLTKKQLIDLLT